MITVLLCVPLVGFISMGLGYASAIVVTDFPRPDCAVWCVRVDAAATRFASVSGADALQKPALLPSTESRQAGIRASSRSALSAARSCRGTGKLGACSDASGVVERQFASVPLTGSMSHC